jgi:hypothetical protein
MWPWTSAVGEDAGVATTRIFQCISKNEQVVKVSLLIRRLGQFHYHTVIVPEPVRLDGHRSKGVAEDFPKELAQLVPFHVVVPPPAVVREVHGCTDRRSLGERSDYYRSLLWGVLLAPAFHRTVEAHPDCFPGWTCGGDNFISTDLPIRIPLVDLYQLTALVLSDQVGPDVPSTRTGIQAKFPLSSSTCEIGQHHVGPLLAFQPVRFGHNLNPVN